MSGKIAARPIRAEEISVVRALLQGMQNAAGFIAELYVAVVTDMPDGQMGGIVFVSDRQEGRRFGEVLGDAEFFDVDGVKVVISLYLDNFGQLYELDFWKTDFSPLRRYPDPADLRPVEAVSKAELIARMTGRQR